METVDLPDDSLVARAFPHVDFADAYRAPLRAAADVDDLARAFFTSPPASMRALLRLRDALVAPFGVARVLPPGDEAADASRASFEPGTRTGLFDVFARTDREILFGLDDRHLDFRLSLSVADGAAVEATVVRFHNGLGRTYFAVVRPFHTRIARTMLARAVERAQPRATA
jgi:hypothetical protein